MGRRSTKLENLLGYAGLVLIIILILIGFSKSLLISFGLFKEVGLDSFTFDFYKEVLADKTFTSSLIFSLKISIVSSFLAIILGTFLSYGIFNSKIYDLYLKIPVILPHIIIAILLLNLFSQTGVIARIFYKLNFIEESNDFIQIFYNKNALGIILTYAIKGGAYAGMLFLEIYRRISPNQLAAAKNLGASDLQEYFYIIFPFIKRESLEIFWILLNFAISSYEVPALIGPTSPRTLALKSYIEFTKNNFSYKPKALVINVFLSLLGLISLIILLISEVGKNEKNF
ncbi:ABC transporter permease subunit [Anaerococcus cruorum]|uniref:ABC transporter permease subunit n=1 Tax=Anaerococcus sp. WGS1529 TaxID=3366812 RepID=UPI00372CEB53